MRRLDEAIRKDPGKADPDLLRAELHRARHHWSLALSGYDVAMSLDSERGAEVDFYRARVQLERGDFYERSFFLAGHYGTSGTLEPPTMILDGGDGHIDAQGAYYKPSTDPAGAVFVVAGSCGKTTPASLDHPVMFVSLLELGSLVVDIDGLRLDATFLGDDGTIRDQFTLIKESPRSGIFTDGFEGGGVTDWSTAVPEAKLSRIHFRIGNHHRGHGRSALYVPSCHRQTRIAGETIAFVSRRVL